MGNGSSKQWASKQAQYRRENPDVSVGDVKKLLKSLEGRVTAEEKGELSEVLNALSVARSLTVNVASVSGSVSTFTLGSFATIGDVKSRMSADEGIPVRQQAILHSSSDKPLQENTELQTLDPLHHSSIELLLSQVATAYLYAFGKKGRRIRKIDPDTFAFKEFGDGTHGSTGGHCDVGNGTVYSFHSDGVWLIDFKDGSSTKVSSADFRGYMKVVYWEGNLYAFGKGGHPIRKITPSTFAVEDFGENWGSTGGYCHVGGGKVYSFHSDGVWVSKVTGLGEWAPSVASAASVIDPYNVL
jgi:hypothetical protein